MQRARRSKTLETATAILAPTLHRARLAIEALGDRWGGSRLVPTVLNRRSGHSSCARVLLCPEGDELERDLAFLRRAGDRLLWPTPDGDLAAAISGLRGGHPASLAEVAMNPSGSDRKSALLLEGTVTWKRARAALSSQARHWIVENPLAVLLTDRQLRELAREGVRWSALERVSIVALLASPRLARARKQWRHLLPRRTKVQVLRPGKGKRKPKTGRQRST